MMKGHQLLENGEEISAIFLTEHMMEIEVRPFVCRICGHRGLDVIRYEAKIGGSDSLVTIMACQDLDACLTRQLLN